MRVSSTAGRRMRLLELFSGTKSVKKAVGHLYEEVISIDILPQYEPTECVNILEWDYKKYPPGYFSAIWASPPCTEYSKAKTRGTRNLSLADSIVLRTLEILDYFQPEKWFLENPQTGMLKDREFMWGLPFVDADYCKYGYTYRKRTRFWTNQDVELKLCNKDCPSFINGSHLSNCGNGYTSDTKTDSIYSGKKRTDKIFNKEEKYSIPSDLVKALFQVE
jgi:hypothetical protein